MKNYMCVNLFWKNLKHGKCHFSIIVFLFTLDLENGKLLSRLEMPPDARMYRQSFDGQLCCLCHSFFGKVEY